MKQNGGQSLVEVVVVAGIIGLASVVLASAVTRAMANNRLAKERIVATRLAQEGWEWLQRQQGDNWIGLFNQIETIYDAGEHYCVGNLDVWNLVIFKNHNDETEISDPVTGECAGFDVSDTTYKREVAVVPHDDVADNNKDYLEVFVTVKWVSLGKEQHVEVKGVLRP